MTLTLTQALDQAAQALRCFLVATIPPADHARWLHTAALCQQTAPITLAHWLGLLVAGHAGNFCPAHLVESVKAASKALLEAAGPQAGEKPARAALTPCTLFAGMFEHRILAARLMAPANAHIATCQDLLTRFRSVLPHWRSLPVADLAALSLALASCVDDLAEHEATEQVTEDDLDRIHDQLVSLWHEVDQALPEGWEHTDMARAVEVLDQILGGDAP